MGRIPPLKQQSSSNRNRNSFLLLFVLLFVLGFLLNNKNLNEYTQNPRSGFRIIQQKPTTTPDAPNTTDAPTTTDETQLNKLQILARQHNIDESRPVPLLKTLGAFIHVGKTGGSTLSSQLKYACHSFVIGNCKIKKYTKDNINAASNLTTYFHTPDFTTRKGVGLYAKPFLFNFYIFTIRDPFERAASAFLYQHPDNVLAERLYPIWKQHAIKRGEYEELLDSYGTEEALVIEYFKNKTLSTMTERKKNRVFRNHIEAYSCFNTLNDFAMMLENSTEIFDDDIHHGNDNDGEVNWEKIIRDKGCEYFAKMIIHGRVGSLQKAGPMDHLGQYSLTTITRNIGIGLTRFQPTFASPLLNHSSHSSMFNDTDDQLSDKLATNGSRNISGALFAVRTRFLKEDWLGVNEYLGQHRDSIVFPRKISRDSSTVVRPAKNEISEEGKKYLCLALRKEYDIFFSLIHSSENLSEKDKQDSLKVAQYNCGKWVRFDQKSLYEIHGPQWLQYCNETGRCPTELGYELE